MAGEKNKLVGCIVKLDPSKGGMLVDPGNDFTFSFFEGGTDEMKIEEGTDLTVIERNIKFGILRVYKKSGKILKDVSEKFGGPPVMSRNMPIVTNGFKRPNNDESSDDRPLLNLLFSNDVNKIARYIESVQDYATLERLFELESHGENPTSGPRPSIINLLSEKKKRISGISMAENNTEQENLTLK